MHDEASPYPEVHVEVEPEDSRGYRASSGSHPPKQAGRRVAARGVHSTGTLPPGFTYGIHLTIWNHVRNGDAPPLCGTGETRQLAPDGSTILSTTIVAQGRDEAEAWGELRRLAMKSIPRGIE